MNYKVGSVSVKINTFVVRISFNVELNSKPVIDSCLTDIMEKEISGFKIKLN
jgi:hypothetical protein